MYKIHMLCLLEGDLRKGFGDIESLVVNLFVYLAVN